MRILNARVIATTDSTKSTSCNRKIAHEYLASLMIKMMSFHLRNMKYKTHVLIVLRSEDAMETSKDDTSLFSVSNDLSSPPSNADNKAKPS